MNVSAFKESLKENNPPTVSVYLQALWYDAKDNWKTGHNLIDHLEDKKACWVHAYLHRKEGDIWNADYWYRKAGRTRPTISIDQEWDEIVKVLVSEEYA